MSMKTKHHQNLSPLIDKIENVLQSVIETEKRFEELIGQVHLHYRESARNLVHYMALRSFDLRQVQEELSMLSISSLGHSEGYTLTNLRKILELLKLLNGMPASELKEQFYSPFNFFRSREQLNQNARNLFGPSTRGDLAQIMVTMDTEAAYNYDLIRSLLLAGMDIARINTSRDRPEEWQRMIDNIRRGEEDTGRHCLVYMDLSGPKLRIQEIDPVRQQVDKKKREYMVLREGDLVKVTSQMPPLREITGEMSVLTISLPEVFTDVQEGEEIAFDDGKVRGIIRRVMPGAFIVEITYAPPKGAKLRVDKGVNLPDTDLNLPSLTEEDISFLPFIATQADIVGYSFVRQPGDVEHLQQLLLDLGREEIGIILKIETKEAFRNLPMLLLTAMQSPKVGVMIARGDLAVEMGFERIAEVQEEILWICESAHIPGVWATQVLEKLAKDGMASRAEITDAAMAGRAECVMLNKGPFIVKAVATLDDIIKRMASHQFKRKSNLRPLQVASAFLLDKPRSAAARGRYPSKPKVSTELP